MPNRLRPRSARCTCGADGMPAGPHEPWCGLPEDDPRFSDGTPVPTEPTDEEHDSDR